MKKLIEQVQESTLPETLREVYVPEKPVSFEEALLYARRRQAARRRAVIANASLLMLVLSLYLYWSRPTSSSTSMPLLQPVPPNEIAKEPTTKSNIGAPPTLPAPTTQPSTQRATSQPTSQDTTPSSRPAKRPTSRPGSLPTERPLP